MTIQHRRVEVNGVGLHTVVAGVGPAIVLLHGWPVTWYHWHDVIARLARDHLVIAPDLRGLGDSDRPAAGYNRWTLAGDVVALTDALGVGSFAVAGHDVGGSVACAIAASHPDRVTRLIVEEELLPGCPAPAALLGRRYPRWRNDFHATLDVPELLIGGRERDYLSLFWALTGPGTTLPVRAIDEYARCYLSPGALRAGLAYHRSASEDAELFAHLARRPLTVPTLVVAGDGAIAGGVEASVGQIADDVSSVVIDDCGHYPAQEHPRYVADLIRRFVGGRAT